MKLLTISGYIQMCLKKIISFRKILIFLHVRILKEQTFLKSKSVNSNFEPFTLIFYIQESQVFFLSNLYCCPFFHTSLYQIEGLFIQAVGLRVRSLKPNCRGSDSSSITHYVGNQGKLLDSLLFHFLICTSRK